MTELRLIILATGILLLWLLYAVTVKAPEHVKEMHDRALDQTTEEYQQEAARLHLLACRHHPC